MFDINALDRCNKTIRQNNCWLISIRLGHLGKYLKKLNNTKITGKKIMFKTNYKIKKLKRKENRRDQNIT